MKQAEPKFKVEDRIKFHHCTYSTAVCEVVYNPPQAPESNCYYVALYSDRNYYYREDILDNIIEKPKVYSQKELKDPFVQKLNQLKTIYHEQRNNVKTKN